MVEIMEYLSRQSRSSLTAASFVLILILGGLDYITGAELAFSIFYLIPVSLAAWFVRKRVGIVASFASATSWLIAELLTGHVHSHPAIPYWNAAVRLGFFLMVAFSVINQGPGIPKEWGERVFDKFVQVEAHKAGRTLAAGWG